MAVFLGQALATSIIQVALDRLASHEVIDYFKGRKLNQKLLQNLEFVLLSANSVLIDAEEKQFTNSAVKKWLDELKDAVYVADDLLDEIATEALRSKSEAKLQTRTKKVWRFVSTLFDKKIQSKLENVLGILQILIEQKKVHNLKEVAGGLPLPPRQLTTSCPEEYGVYGRDIDKEEIFKKFQLDNANGDEICVVPIVGMGGVELPTNMGRLVNLRHLDIRGTHLKGMPIDVGKLRSLQNLSAFYVGKEKRSGSSIKELGELPRLFGSLCISNLENVYQTRDAKEVNLKDKKGLSELELKWRRCHENYDSKHERDVLEQLYPHMNLKSLSIISYYGAEYPSWLGACSFSNMVSLKLDDCKYCSSLPPLGQLPSLKELSIEGLNRVSCVDSKFYGDGSCATNKPFKSLEKLTFRGMPEWKEWFIFEGEDEGGVFPTLQELRIILCPMLTGYLPSLLPSLSVIEIRDCPQLVASLPSPSTLHELALTNCDKVVLKELSPKLQSLTVGGCHATLPEGGLPTTLKTLQINGVLQLLGSHYYPSIESFKANRGPGSLWSLPLEFFPKLKSIEIWDSNNFESLSASDKSLLDQTSLTKLTMHECPNFVSFPSGGLCAPNLTEISISFCKKLKSLAESMHTLLPSLLYLELCYCPELESFPEGGLQSLEIGSCDKLFLRRMEWGLQSLHSLREIVIRYHGREVGSFPEEALLPPSLIRLTISFPHLTSLNGSGFEHLALLKQLEIWSCHNLQCLPEEGFPASLSILDIYECPMLKKRHHISYESRSTTAQCHFLLSITSDTPTINFMPLVVADPFVLCKTLGQFKASAASIPANSS
nr:putative disease resistance rpp13-like protein 1 [Quercus suber]